MKLIVSCLVFITLNPAFSAIQGRIKDNVVRFRTEVMELGARLNTIEKEINNKKNLYSTSIEQIKQFEADVKLYREKLTDLHQQVRQAQDENRIILKNYLVETDIEDTDLWQRKVHFELLKQAQSKLKNKEQELISFENKVAQFDNKLSNLKKDEEELVNVISELETRKKSTMKLYMAQVENKKMAESKEQNIKLRERFKAVKKEHSTASVIETKPDRLFKRPVDDFKGLTSSSKGITFKYRAIQPVKAVAEGKVVFAGDLSNYGQVVLIDHGKELRTVLLGKMDIKVKKNDLVKDGDILAYTQNDSRDDQNLYFEVRKKNTAQNTILWLDQNGVGKI